MNATLNVRKPGHLTLDEVATKLCVHYQTVRRYTKENRRGHPKLRSTHWRGRVWITQEWLAEFTETWCQGGVA